MNLNQQINQLDWQKICQSLQDKGYALVSNFLSDSQCQSLIKRYDNESEYRKTVDMKRYRFGFGEYKYWNYPLPDIVKNLREGLYPHLVPVANVWMQCLNLETCFPQHLPSLTSQCEANGQMKPTPLILKYPQTGFNTLHQDLYGEVYFPIQAAIVLSQKGEDYQGGEFVMTRQVPRAQSQAIVLTPNRGDMIIFTTNFKPEKGVRGYYRVNMKHGISEVLSGERYAMGIIFHDATS